MEVDEVVVLLLRPSSEIPSEAEINRWAFESLAGRDALQALLDVWDGPLESPLDDRRGCGRALRLLVLLPFGKLLE